MAFHTAQHLQDRLKQAMALQNAGRWLEAEAAYRQLLELGGQEPEIWNSLGVVLATQGRGHEAIGCFERALAITPGLAAAHHNLIRTHQAAQNLPAAKAACHDRLRREPRDSDTLYALGWVHQHGGEAGEALQAYEQALAVSPANYAARVGRAEALMALGRLPEAASAYKAALASQPGRPEAPHGYGRLLESLGQVADAQALWRKVIDKRPGFAPAWISLVGGLWRSGQADAARSLLQAAALAQPPVPVVLAALGAECVAHGALADAVTCYRQALAIEPNHAPWLNRLALVHLELGQHRDLIEVLQRLLALLPDDVATQAALGRAYTLVGEPEAALAAYERAIALGGPDGIRLSAALVLPAMPDSLAELTRWRGRQAQALQDLLVAGLSIADPEREVGLTNFYSAYHGLDDRPVQEMLARLYLQACPSLAWVAPHCRTGTRPHEDDRLHIGFVSRFLCAHTIGKLNAGFIEHLDRQACHVTLIQLGTRDRVTGQLAALADAALYPTGTLAEIREQIGDLGLDALIFTDIGMESTSYYLAFSRLAPVQVVTWGHPVTTGIPTVDYFLSDASLEPAGAQDHYRERLVSLGVLPCVYPEPATPPDDGNDRQALGLSPEAHLYVCPQTLFKLHPDFDAYLAGILQADPQGRLVFIAGRDVEGWQQRLSQRLARYGEDVVARTDFLGHLGQADYFRLLRAADVLLDPLHFGGGNSAYEAIAIGTPVVTQPGAFMRGRVMSACYGTIGVTDTVVGDRDAYVAMALALAADPQRRRDLRERILQHKHRLFNTIWAARRLEAFLTDAVASPGQALPGWELAPA